MDETVHMIERMNNESEMADITIIVPVYNTGKYLEKCVDSIISQTIPVREIILVDDGSMDESAEICDQYARKKKNITVIHQLNNGVSYARYVGLLNAHSKYVLYIDSDDYIRRDLIEKIISYMKKGIDIISFSKTNYFDDTYQRRGQIHVPSGYYDRKMLEEKIFPNMLWDATRHVCGIDASLCNKAIKKELFGNNLKDISQLGIHYGEDVGTVYFIILEAQNMVILDDCLYYHRQREDGKIASYIQTESFIENLYKLYEYMKERINDEWEMKKQLEYFVLHAMEVRMRVYGDNRTRRGYVFPFDKVKKGKNIVLYGAGAVGQDYYRQVKAIHYCNEVLWAAQNYHRYIEMGVQPVSKVYEDAKWDYIVLSLLSDTAAAEIRDTMVKRGIKEDIIIWSVS